MKRFLALLILISLLFTLISCGQKKYVYNGENEESETPNFSGSTFVLYSDGVWLSDTRKRGGSASGDRKLDRIEAIENAYNVKIRNEYYNLETKMLTLTLTGGGGCDMVYCSDFTLLNFYNLGILTPFSEIGVKDHEATKFGIPSLLYGGNYDGKQYGIVNYLSDSVPTYNGTLTLNMNLFSDFGMDDPHEYVELGEWNWQNFRKVLEQGTFDDGEYKHVGLLIDWLIAGIQTFLPAIIANGGNLIHEDNGVYKSGLTDSNTIEAIEFMTGLVSEGLVQVAGGSVWDVYGEGNIWPMAANMGFSTDEIEYSIVRFPYGPHGNKDIVASFIIYRNYYAFTILSNFENDDIGIIVDDLFEPLDASLYPEGWKDYAIDNLFYSDADYETFMIGLDSVCYYPLAKLYGTNPWNHDGEVEEALANVLYGRGSLQAEIDSVEDLFARTINEQLNGIK